MTDAADLKQMLGILIDTLVEASIEDKGLSPSECARLLVEADLATATRGITTTAFELTDAAREFRRLALITMRGPRA